MKKNPTWIYLDGSHLSVYLHCSDFFKDIQTFSKTEDNGRGVTVQILKYKNTKTINVAAWYTPVLAYQKGYEYLNSRLLFDCDLVYSNHQQYELSINLPETYPEWEKYKSWDAVARLGSSFDKVPTNESSSTHRVYKKSPDQWHNESVPLELRIDEFMSPKKAKKTWRYIKRHHLVSKFIWDDWMQYWDCYCKACKTGNDKKDFVSWVGNPDVGYVRFAKNVNPKRNKVFKYKNLLYTPCYANEYSRLKFYNKEEYEKEVLDVYKPETIHYLTKTKYNEEAKKLGKDWFNEYGLLDICSEVNGKFLPPSFEEFQKRTLPLDKNKKIPKNRVTFDWLVFNKRYPPFDELHKIELTNEDIAKNGNIIGGAWRGPQNTPVGKIYATDEKMLENGFEEVVTLGWHRTEIKDAQRCPVCEDLYEIICRSGYDPVPFYMIWCQKLRWLFHNLKAKKRMF